MIGLSRGTIGCTTSRGVVVVEVVNRSPRPRDPYRYPIEMRYLKLIRFNLATALLFTAMIAWSLAWGRLLDTPGILLGHFLLVLIAAACFGSIAMVRQFGRPRFGACKYPLWMIAYGLIPFLYLASTGPAIWVCARFYNADSQNTAVLNAYNAMYEPAATCIVEFPDKTVHDFGISYLRLWMPDGTTLHARRRYLGLHSVSKTNPNRGLNYRMPCYFTLSG